MAEDVRIVSNQTAVVRAAFELAARRAIVATQDAFLQEIEQAMDEPKSGRIYGTHQASAPGEAPARDTGDYLSATDKSTIDVSGDVVQGAVFTNAPQARRLELGDEHVAARPMWHQIADEQAPLHRERIAAEIAKIK